MQNTAQLLEQDILFHININNQNTCKIFSLSDSKLDFLSISSNVKLGLLQRLKLRLKWL